MYDVEAGWVLRKDVHCRNLRWTVTDTCSSPDQIWLAYATINPTVHLVRAACSKSSWGAAALPAGSACPGRAYILLVVQLCQCTQLCSLATVCIQCICYYFKAVMVYTPLLMWRSWVPR